MASHYYCYICNMEMQHNTFVCSAHETDPLTEDAFMYILNNTTVPRHHASDPLLDLSAFGICTDLDLWMDAGL